MRSSQKSGRSRGKGNRGKSQGHSPNRVYESAGPEGKVRGTPQQIIDKYLALARDAQLSGDRVGSENFLQHAEHYARILITAQEAAAERRDQNQPNQGGGQQTQPPQDAQPAVQPAVPVDAPPAAEAAEQPSSDGLGAIDAAQAQPDIVETPESKGPQPKPRTRRPRPKPAAESDAPAAEDTPPPPVEAAE
ncbi:MAG: DUF4167 domain-containing protein [Pseudomonadota bacterium]